MALMKDKQPDNYEGEKQVWQCIKDNLPEDILCYYNREVKGREFDFCLLIKDVGFMIIEVKGWDKSQKIALRMTYTDQNGMARDVTLISNADAGKACTSGK